jgi:hypothetical protein
MINPNTSKTLSIKDPYLSSDIVHVTTPFYLSFFLSFILIFHIDVNELIYIIRLSLS